MRRTVMAASALIAVAFCLSGAVENRHSSGVSVSAFSLKPEPEFEFAAIPEPGALVSLIGGAAVLVGIQRFRRRT